MKTRLKDIADATGFSVNTVSHALRDEPDISEATKAIIRRVADELDYIPNFQARGVRAGKSSIISVILPDIINPHFSIVFRGIEQYFRAFGITPLFMNTAENADDELRAETEKWLQTLNRTSGYLFLNRFGERITTRGISQQLKNYAMKYGLNEKVVYPHSFRHRYAKNFLEKFNDIALLADLMGHESIETTRIYLRRSSLEQQEIVDKVITW